MNNQSVDLILRRGCINSVSDYSIILGEFTFPCAIGKTGLSINKTEGDKATPCGKFPLRQVFYRPDKYVHGIQTSLPSSALKTDDGWCDDPKDINYNKHIKLPYGASHEKLWREDHIYDIILVVGHNDEPVVPLKGSAIFIHLSRLDEKGRYGPTDGCLSFNEDDLLHILRLITPESCLIIPFE